MDMNSFAPCLIWLSHARRPTYPDYGKLSFLLVGKGSNLGLKEQTLEEKKTEKTCSERVWLSLLFLLDFLSNLASWFGGLLDLGSNYWKVMALFRPPMPMKLFLKGVSNGKWKVNGWMKEK